MTDKMREQFEEYWLKKRLESWLKYPKCTEENLPENWGLSYRNHALAAWQASRACIEVELPTTSCSDSAHSLGWNECLFECEAAIESHGLRVKT